jgi:hypothetical protein
MARHVSKANVAGATGAIAGAVVGVLSACGAGAAEPPTPAAAALELIDKSPSVSVFAGKRLVLEYRYAEVPFKPYVKQLFTPGGVNVLLDAPSDHLHHHGLMFSVAAGGVDFWSETPANGKQVHKSLELLKPAARGGRPTAGLVEQIEWLGPDGKCRLAEVRTLEVVVPADPNATLVTWRSRLSCPQGAESVKLTGDHYFGLGMRFVRSMDKVAVFRNAEGAADKTGTHVRGSEYVAPSAWCAAAGPVDGKQVTAAMFGHPDCTRFPVHWFTMTDGFAYLAATMNLWKQPLTVDKDKPLELWYGVAVWDGPADNARVEKLRGQWVQLYAAKSGNR